MAGFSAKNEIEALLIQERNLREAINELEKQRSHKFSNSVVSKKCNTDYRSFICLPEKMSHQRKWLKISELINKVKYRNEEVKLLADGSKECVADAVIKSLVFNINMRVEDEQDHVLIHSLKVQIEDPFQENELKSWLNSCQRERNLQILIKGLVSYDTWYRNREAILNWMKLDFGSQYTIEKSQEDAVFTIIARTDTYSSPLFSCKWTIVWKRSSLCMIPSFIFILNRTSTFFKENEYLFKKLSSLGLTTDEVTDMWKRVSFGLTTTTESGSET